jgi:uncharacterized protein YcfJ
MKSGYLFAPLVLALSVAALAPNANAQPYPPQSYPPAPPPRETVTYGYATVLSVNPAFETYHAVEQQCDDGGYQRVQNDTTGGTIVGAIVGGALGNTVGKGDGRTAATVVGAVAGGAIGHNIAKNSDSGYYQGGCRMVDVERSDRRPAGFDVEYNYKGDVYVARMPYDPGNRIRVRVSVVPAEDGPPPYRR